MLENFSATRMKTSQGIILLEIMLAMSLGLFILSLLLAMYQTSQQSLRLQQALYQLQDRTNFAVTLLTDNIKQAGQIGCPRLSSSLSLPVISKQNKLIGTASEITVRYARLGPALISAMHTRTELDASVMPPIQSGKVVIIANCIRAEAAQVAHVYPEKNRQHIILQHPLLHLFGKQTEVGMLTSHHYFIKRTQRNNPDGTPVYALFDNQDGRRNIELVAGVTAMQFLYTIKQGEKIVDAEAEQIVDWSQVMAVAIHFTLFVPPFKREAYAYVVLNARPV